MDNPETQAILGTRHRTKTYKTKNGESRDTGNIGHKTQNEDIQNKEWRIQRHRQYWAQGTERRHTKQRMENPETQAILTTRHRMKTYKTKNGESRDTGNIGNKAQNEDIQNKNIAHKTN
jgi:hypothetical protein